MAVVYLHRKKIDNSIYYVGIGNDKSRSEVVYGRNNHWERVYKKYGINIDVIADNIPLEDAKELEIFLIQEIGINNLCNQTLGGEGFFGGNHTEEAKRKISDANKGRKLSKETKNKISKALKGHPNYLKSQTEESRRKIGLASKNRKFKNESKKKISLKHKQNNHKPNKQALESATKIRRKNGIKIKDLNTGFEFMAWESENYYKVPKRIIYQNSLTNKPIKQGKYKGENFKRIQT